MKKSYFKKNILYVIITVIISTSLSGTAAVCNMCGPQTDQAEKTDKIDVERTENEQGNSQQTPAGNNDNGGDGNQDDQGNSPTVRLRIYEGPKYSETDDVCYYGVEAIVTGNPTPDIIWSKDDSNNAYGDFKAQVNLTRDNPEYTLVATVSNDNGTITESIDLSWACDGNINGGGDNNGDDEGVGVGNGQDGNSNPQIVSITLSEDTIYTGDVYAVIANASDPDGDDISYHWKVSGGSIANNSTNPMQWTAPGNEGSYTIELTVKDGNNGQSEKTKTVNVISGQP